ncbi:cytochrome P450 [Streptomyces sp. NPDC096311]|uniref:cytochrome P450 n=1 Tax=Streptomyces sp. NPDC096311 TaxID=3366083 RepID=UPI00382B01EA
MTATDPPVFEFDHLSPQYAAEPMAVNRAMREQCPVVWTEAHSGFWVTATYAETFAAGRDPATYSSKKGRHAGLDHTGVVIPALPSMHLLPVEVDPPELRAYRKVMNPAFSPQAVARLLPDVERFTTWCVDQVIASGAIDFVDDLATPVPAMTTLLIVGLPPEDWPQHAKAFHGLVSHVPGTPGHDEAITAIAAIDRSVFDEIADRRAHPRDDLLTMLTQADIDGRPLTDEEVAAIVATTLGGGVDTTTALLANAFSYLGEHPEHRDRIAEDDAYLNSFCEEMLRYYSPVQGFARTVTEDTDLGGCPLGRGDRIFLNWSAANHDPAEFARPEEVVPDRSPNRHAAFGIGPHRCIGAPVARAEFGIVVREVLRRMPDYTLAPGAEHYTNIGTVNGWHHLPARFTPGSPVGGAA